jgi:hypothetical protein
MALLYNAPPQDRSSIDQLKLQYHYYAQLAPDGKHLVPGLLQQGTRPADGIWIDVGKVRRDFPVRYFVQYTDFHTLAPGSLIPGDRLPEGQWKEVKKQTRGPWYQVTFTDPDVYVLFPLGSIDSFASYNEFNGQKVLPALDLVFPDRDPDEGIKIRLFYFHGDYEALNEDASQLFPFAVTGDFAVFVTGLGYTDILFTAPPMNAELRATVAITPGTFSIVLGIFNDSDVVTDYVVLENVLHVE